MKILSIFRHSVRTIASCRILAKWGVSAAVKVNGVSVGSTFRRLLSVDITDVAEAGENDVVLPVAKHFDAETPKRYIDTTVDRFDKALDLLPTVDPENYVSGLLGPVTMRIEPAVSINAFE